MGKQVEVWACGLAQKRVSRGAHILCQPRQAAKEGSAEERRTRGHLKAATRAEGSGTGWGGGGMRLPAEPSCWPERRWQSQQAPTKLQCWVDLGPSQRRAAESLGTIRARPGTWRGVKTRGIPRAELEG